MHFAHRVSDLHPSATLALNSTARELRTQGKKLYNLAGGEPGFPTPAPVVQEAIQALKEGKTRYSDAGGAPALREAIAAKYGRENNLSYRTDEVVVGCGSKEILFHNFLAILNPGDEVILPAPFWVSYHEQIKICGAVPVIVPFDPEAPGLDVARLEKYATAKTKALMLNYPNNPSGYVPTVDELQTLGSYLQGRDWWIVTDEIYEYLVFARQHFSILNVCPELRAQTILINGLSKGFAMTGWRVGYALGERGIIAQIKKFQSHSTTCLPQFVERAAIIAMQQGKSLVQDQIAEMRKKRSVALKLLGEVKELTFISPHGSFYVFARLPKRCGSALSFSERLLHNHGVMVVPGEAFGVSDHIRISCTAPPQEIETGIRLLAEALT